MHRLPTTDDTVQYAHPSFFEFEEDKKNLLDEAEK